MRILSLSDLSNLTLVPLSEHELVKEIKFLTAGFTDKRENIGEYVLSEKAIAAYALFYLPTNMPKLYFLYNRLKELHGLKFFEQLATETFIDFGSGPGTFSLAHLFYMESLGLSVKKIHLIDSSSLMLKQAVKIIKAFFPNVEVIMSRDLSPGDLKDQSFLFFGHSLNELSEQELQSPLFLKTLFHEMISTVSWIEPGTPAFFHKQKTIRENLIAENWDILYPCVNNARCPLHDNQEEWCHQILRVTHHEEVERLGQLVQLDRKILPMSSFFWKRKDRLLKPVAESVAFPIRFLDETKFSFDFLFCGDFTNEKKLELKKGEMLKRHLNKNENKILKHRSLGHPLIRSDIEFKNDFFRVKKIQLLEQAEEES